MLVETDEAEAPPLYKAPPIPAEGALSTVATVLAGSGAGLSVFLEKEIEEFLGAS